MIEREKGGGRTPSTSKRKDVRPTRATSSPPKKGGDNMLDLAVAMTGFFILCAAVALFHKFTD